MKPKAETSFQTPKPNHANASVVIIGCESITRVARNKPIHAGGLVTLEPFGEGQKQRYGINADRDITFMRLACDYKIEVAIASYTK